MAATCFYFSLGQWTGQQGEHSMDFVVDDTVHIAGFLFHGTGNSGWQNIQGLDSILISSQVNIVDTVETLYKLT